MRRTYRTRNELMTTKSTTTILIAGVLAVLAMPADGIRAANAGQPQEIAITAPDGGDAATLTVPGFGPDATVTSTHRAGMQTIRVVEGTAELIITATFASPVAMDPLGRTTPLIPGLEDEIAYSGVIELEGSGINPDDVITVALSYSDEDIEGIDESRLRLNVFSNEDGQYIPAGTNDVGDAPPTGVLNDYGVHTATNKVWAERRTLGSFVIGIPTGTLPLAIVEDDGTPTACAAGGGMCGAMGMLSLPMMLASLLGWRRRRLC